MRNILKGICNWYNKEDKVFVWFVLIINIVMITFACMLYR